MKKLLISLAALGIATVAANAQTASNFADLDIDMNGELSFSEITVAWPDLTQEEFDAADADASGGLSADEVATIQGASAAPVPGDATTLPAPTDGMMTEAPAVEGETDEDNGGGESLSPTE